MLCKFQHTKKNWILFSGNKEVERNALTFICRLENDTVKNSNYTLIDTENK